MSVASPVTTSYPLVHVNDLRHVFQSASGRVYAINGVNFQIEAGEAVGLVGESGSGKSTVAKCLVRLLDPTSGRITFDGQEIVSISEGAFRPLRRRIQMVFQDPTMSLNPRLSVRQTLSEPLKLHRIATNGSLDEHLGELMDLVSLDRRFLSRRPHQLSGGQRQRVGIARAIATRPDFLVLDEPTSSLDMSIRIQIIALLKRLQAELGMTYLFISHDLSTVRYLCSRVIVMYLGQVVEEGPVEEIFNNPKHPYTQALLSAVPIPDPTRRHERKRIILPGETPHLTRPISGCPLADRCPYVEPSHRQGRIPYFDVGPHGHRAACLLYAPNGIESGIPNGASAKKQLTPPTMLGEPAGGPVS